MLQDTREAESLDKSNFFGNTPVRSRWVSTANTSLAKPFWRWSSWRRRRFSRRRFVETLSGQVDLFINDILVNDRTMLRRRTLTCWPTRSSKTGDIATMWSKGTGSSSRVWSARALITECHKSQSPKSRPHPQPTMSRVKRTSRCLSELSTYDSIKII